MSRNLLTAAIAVFVLPFVTAGAQVNGGVAGGVSAPLGDFGKVAKSGYHVTGLLALRAPLAPVGARVEGSFSEFKYKGVTNGAKARILSATANAVFSAPGIVGPYLIGGVGIYHATAECSSCNASSTKVGFNGGGGVKVGLGGLSVFVEARYHYLPGASDPTTGGVKSSTQFIPVSLGLTF